MEEFNSRRSYIIKKGTDLSHINVIRKTNKCYLIKFKDADISYWHIIDDFHDEYETIECLFEYAGF